MARLRVVDETIIGKRFGDLVVIGCEDVEKGLRYSCKCDCGKIINGIHKYSLTNKEIEGCEVCNKKYRKRRRYSKSELARDLMLGYNIAALKRNLPFELSLETFMQLTSGNCYYCGAEPRQKHKPRKYCEPYIYNGIDRLDSSKGYFLDNCVSCCRTCNVAKNAMTESEFYSWIERVYSHKKLGSGKN